MKLELRGVIVPSAWDCDYMNKYIEKGIIMPESRFRSQLASASKDEDLDVYINSPGGSVMAGNEIINALNAWADESKKNINITVGAVAASMAANMLCMVNASKVSVSKNSKIMFHGASSFAIGGEGAMEDTAELLGKMNADIKAALVSKTSLDPEKIDDWMAEGRMGWLNAEEAKECGLIDEILDSSAEALVVDKNTERMLSDKGLKIAALAEAVGMEIVDDADPEPQSSDPEPNADPEPQSSDPTIAELSDKIVGLNDALNEQTKIAREWQSKHDSMKQQLEDAKAEFEKEKEAMSKDKLDMEQRLAKLSLDITKLSTDEVTSWEAALAKFDGDFAKAKAAYPNLHKAYFDSRNNNK